MINMGIGLGIVALLTLPFPIIALRDGDMRWLWIPWLLVAGGAIAGFIGAANGL